MLKLYVQDFLRYRYLLYNLISRDFKLKYRRSVLGVAWSVLNPLMMCAVMFVIFNTLMAGMRGEGIENFAVYLVIGQLLFNFFRESTTMAMSSVMNNAMLLQRSLHLWHLTQQAMVELFAMMWELLNELWNKRMLRQKNKQSMKLIPVFTALTTRNSLLP